ncbi:hypothetical protein ABEB36_008579 [Hypothenemus hampei]|uniref:SWIM-type domain-containing protein n=1 Tax=Hypothenemus hampei TaxID=57062 RepID=A0ABD1EMH0_HYPHA
MRHKNTERLPSDSIVEMETGWEFILKISNYFEVHCIKENLNYVYDFQLVCPEWNTCLHKYFCTCRNASIRGNMCKQMHLLCKYLEENSGTIRNQLSLNSKDNTGLFEHLNDDDGNLNSLTISHGRQILNHIKNVWK